MLNITYKKGDLFSDLLDKKESILLHACNAQGRWGSGVAKTFHKYFPRAFQQYQNTNNRVGMGYIVEERGYKIGCLVTSNNYGPLKDVPLVILKNTEAALINLINSQKDSKIVIHSPKINAGLFSVPWADTEKIIRKVCESYNVDIDWTVWEI